MDTFLSSDDLADGGAALTTLAKIQFTMMSELERDLVIQGLLRYCELDTLAMVMIYKFWKDEVAYTPQKD